MMIEAAVEPKPIIASSPAATHKSPASSKKSTKGKSPRKNEKESPSPRVPKKSTNKVSTKKLDKGKAKHLDSPMPPPNSEKKLKRKMDAASRSKESAETTSRDKHSDDHESLASRRNSPSRVSELLSWENKEHDKLFSTQSVEPQEMIQPAVPPSAESARIFQSPGKMMVEATTSLATQMNFLKPSTPFEVERPRLSVVSPELKGTSKSKAKRPENHPLGPPPRSPKASSSTTPRQTTKKPILDAVSPRPTAIAPELNLMKRTTPFEVDAPRQVLRQPARIMSSDSVTSYDDGCLTEEQRVWKGIDSVLMDADSVSTTASEHVMKARSQVMHNSTRSRSSGRELHSHLSKRSLSTPMTAGDIVSVASMEDVNSKSMLRAVRKNSMASSMNVSKVIPGVVEEGQEDDYRQGSDDASLPSLASLSTCNTSTSSSQKAAPAAKAPSKLDRFMQKSKQMSKRKDDSSMPSLSSFRDDDFSQCSNSVLSMGMPSLCSIREDEMGSYRSESDEDWRNGVATIPEGNEAVPESPVRGKYADIWAETPIKESDEFEQSVESLQLEDLMSPSSPMPPPKAQPKQVIKKRRSLSGAEQPVQQSKLRSFMSSFTSGADNNEISPKQTDVVSIGSAGDIHTGTVSPGTVRRLHASDGCLLGTYHHEGSCSNDHNSRSIRPHVLSGNMSATDFNHFASEHCSKAGVLLYGGGGVGDNKDDTLYCPSTPSRHRRAQLLARVSNSIAKMKSRVMTKGGVLSPKLY